MKVKKVCFRPDCIDLRASKLVLQVPPSFPLYDLSSAASPGRELRMIVCFMFACLSPMDEAFNETTSPYRIHSCLSHGRCFHDACVLAGKHRRHRHGSADPQISATRSRQIDGCLIGEAVCGLR